ncbi:MAG: alpha/beta hydrolase [Proteobacteria bacterium]|nr:alpha/beta hydrolase [Pseudomonadota bacterium]
MTRASGMRRFLRRAAAAVAIASVSFAALAAYGWWVEPAIIVVPLRQVAYLSSGVDSLAIEADGHRWPYLATGPVDGPPIVFLHGFGTSKDAMMQLATEFGRRGWRAYAPDLPAFGEHAYHEGHVHDAAFYVHAVGAFMDAVGAPHATVVGTSMGGALACELAIEDPERVDALLMLSPAGVVPKVRNEFMRHVDAGENPLDIASEEDFLRVMNYVFVRPPKVPAPFLRWFVDAARARRPQTLEVVEAMKPFLVDGLVGRMGSVAAPTLVLYGALDAVTDPSMMQCFVAEIPSARTALVPDAGHVAFSDNFPGTVRAMCEFLEWTGQARGGHPAAAR